jgi:CRP/FNR family transcriptional regulator, cyclic AMP receptor protein
MDVNALIAAQPMFAGLDGPALADVRQNVSARKFKAGETIFLKGDDAGPCHMIATGFVRLSMLSAEGRELSVRLATAGAMFGEIAALDGASRTTDATAVTAVETYMLARPALKALISRHAPINGNIIALLCTRLRATTSQAESIALHQLEARTAAVLLELFAHVPGERKGRFSTHMIDLNQRDIAALAGASRPKVNQVLMQWTADGFLKREKSRWSVDTGALQDIAEAS